MSRKVLQNRPRLIIAVAAAILVLALALGLGLGLGLGLEHRHDDSSKSQTLPPTSSLPVLNPQPSSNFVVGAIFGQSPQNRVYNFTVALANGAPDGVNKTMVVINGMYPGPTIEANQGDRLIVNVHNNLPNTTTVHWHGLFQNGTNWFDGTPGITECGIPPGQSLTYNVTFGEFSGTSWYHALSTQSTDGVTGAMIVHPTQNPPALPAYDNELVIQMADLYHDFSEVLLAEYLSPAGIGGQAGNEPVPDGGVINGLGQYSSKGSGGSYFDYTIQRGKIYRIRLVNTGSITSIRFSVDDHPLTLIEADGTLLTPTSVSGVTVAVGQRYSVLLSANQTTVTNGTYWIRATLQNNMFTYDQPGQNVDIRGIFRYSDGAQTGNPNSPSSPDPGPGTPGLANITGTTTLTPLVPNVPPNATREVSVSILFQPIPSGANLAYLNYTSYQPLKGTTTLLQVQRNPSGYAPLGGGVVAGNQLILTEDSIQVVDLTVINLDNGDHPFHMHGHRPWIMGTGTGNVTGPPYSVASPLNRDTVLIPANSWLVLRFITDNPGIWAFHCHISWHMAAGLLMQISSQPTALSKLTVPQDIVTQCNARDDR